MKVFKYSLMVLVFAVVANVTLAHALIMLVAPNTGISGQTTLKRNEESYPTDTVIKSQMGTQYFKNNNTFTTYTDPCPKCKITADLWKNSSGIWNHIKYASDVTMGNSKAFSNNTSEDTGSYYIKLKRSDITAAWTYVTWDWIVQKYN